jgi:hypothetical protein
MDEVSLEALPTDKKKRTEEGVAATLDVEELADQALLKLAPHWWFKVWMIISGLLALSEPFLVAWPDETNIAQKVVLAVSSLLFLIGYGMVMAFMPEGTLWQRFYHACLGETWIEIFSFAIGWGLIFQDPAMATLRCFRIFRFVWYAEFYRAKKGTIFFPFTFLMQKVLQYLEQIGKELFTTQSKGGVVVLIFFFYMAYVVGNANWQRTRFEPLISSESGNVSECDTLAHCWLIMLRLTFWDGSGFDYLLSVMNYGDGGDVTLLILYMCFSAMVLLNGLIGIFGGAFQEATKEDGEEEEEGEKKEEEEKKGDLVPSGAVLDSLDRLEKLVKKLEADIADLKAKNSS